MLLFSFISSRARHISDVLVLLNNILLFTFKIKFTLVNEDVYLVPFSNNVLILLLSTLVAVPYHQNLLTLPISFDRWFNHLQSLLLNFFSFLNFTKGINLYVSCYFFMYILVQIYKITSIHHVLKMRWINIAILTKLFLNLIN